MRENGKFRHKAQISPTAPTLPQKNFCANCQKTLSRNIRNKPVMGELA